MITKERSLVTTSKALYKITFTVESKNGQNILHIERTRFCIKNRIINITWHKIKDMPEMVERHNNKWLGLYWNWNAWNKAVLKQSSTLHRALSLKSLSKSIYLLRKDIGVGRWFRKWHFSPYFMDWNSPFEAGRLVD